MNEQQPQIVGTKRKRNDAHTSHSEESDTSSSDNEDAEEEEEEEEEYTFDDKPRLGPCMFAQPRVCGNHLEKSYHLALKVNKVHFHDGSIAEVSLKDLVAVLDAGVPVLSAVYMFTLMAVTYESEKETDVISLEVVANIANLLLADYLFFNRHEGSHTKPYQVTKKVLLNTQIAYWRIAGEVLYLRRRTWLAEPWYIYTQRLYRLLRWDHEKVPGSFCYQFFTNANSVN
jgi:hypothetical protein